MTCIIGFADPKDKKIYIGGDSAGVSGYSVQVRADEKVFRNGPFIMGFTTSFRMGQLLRYVFEPPAQAEGVEDYKYMVATFIPAVKKCFDDGDFEKGGEFILGYKGSLYEVSSDFQVAKMLDNIASVGCGAKIALGAMHALTHLYPKERILKSLEITTYLNAGVRPPFIIEEI